MQGPVQDQRHELSRRTFLRRAGVALAAVSLAEVGAGMLAGCGVANEPRSVAAAEGPDPRQLSWRLALVTKDEPGQPLHVSGRILGPDGKTPLAGALLYVYHTDARGIYSEDPRADATRDARIKGWLRTRDDGRYEITTIRPASYPGMNVPQHIHAKASADGLAERWVNNFWFADDPNLDDGTRAKYQLPDAFSPIMSVERGADGVLRCVRDIKLVSV